jgi:hypothetical protein
MAEEVACKRIKTDKELRAGPDGAAAAEEGRPDGEISVKIKSEALRCRICLEPLKPPIFMVNYRSITTHRSRIRFLFLRLLFYLLSVAECLRPFFFIRLDRFKWYFLIIVGSKSENLSP